MKANNIDEQDIRINKIISNIDKKDIIALLNAWKEHLENVIVFPFEAMVLGYLNKGPLKFSDKVSVKRIDVIDDLYGVIVELRCGRKKYYHPLSDLKIIDEKSTNYQHIEDYSVWMANR